MADGVPFTCEAAVARLRKIAAEKRLVADPGQWDDAAWLDTTAEVLLMLWPAPEPAPAG